MVHVILLALLIYQRCYIDEIRTYVYNVLKAVSPQNA